MFQLEYKTADADKSLEILKSQQTLLKISEAALILIYIFFNIKAHTQAHTNPSQHFYILLLHYLTFKKIMRARQDKLFLV